MRLRGKWPSYAAYRRFCYRTLRGDILLAKTRSGLAGAKRLTPAGGLRAANTTCLPLRTMNPCLLYYTEAQAKGKSYARPYIRIQYQHRLLHRNGS